MILLTRSEAGLIGRTDGLSKVALNGNLKGGVQEREVGMSEDITRADNDGETPMWIACKEGELMVCQWLFEMGASADITRASDNGATPMWIACQEGHLPVCQWLFEVGASADITRANDNGYTPMWTACCNGHLLVCQWLMLNSALNDQDDHVNEEAVVRDVGLIRQMASELHTWTQEMIAVHSTFLHVVLRSSVCVPLSQQHKPPQQRCRLPMLNRGVMEVVGSYLGLVIGRKIRNVQEVSAALS